MGGREQASRALSDLDDVIAGRSGSPIWKTFRIGDVARVEDGLADMRRLSRNNGKPAVDLGIKKQRGSNSVAVLLSLLEACPIRLRPILMTSVATIAAAVPPALGFGPGLRAANTRTPSRRCSSSWARDHHPPV
ncbi:MAG: efflux RND transporter permease subunit [Elusimicrobia bacterium]|nr:efflux RND transporter permease subunit [Elusimicrobiota bacterium]